MKKAQKRKGKHVSVLQKNLDLQNTPLKEVAEEVNNVARQFKEYFGS